MADQPEKQGKDSVAVNRQRQVYVSGVSGQKPRIPLSAVDLARLARSSMSEKAFAYVAGGAGLEETIAQNRQGFDRIRILPRMLKDVSERDLSIQLFNRQLPTPFLLAPIGVLEMAHPKADKAVAAAAATRQIPMIFSNQASVPMETTSGIMGESPRWFQLYWSKSDALVQSLVQRAENAGCEAIVVTLDTTLLGWRPRDLNLAYLPFLEGMGIAQYTSDPVFQALLDQPQEAGPPVKRRITLQTLRSVFKLMRRYPGGMLENLRSGRPLKAVRQFINIYSRPSLSWEDIPKLRDYTNLPILLKGILHPDDAKKALDIGIDGLIISNHGGRQVDGAVSSIEMLPSIAEVTAGKIPLLLDSGIRTGADAFKALALGATAVCLGRPYVYALSIGGQAGVEEYLDNMVADLELTMALAGCRSVSSINHQCLSH